MSKQTTITMRQKDKREYDTIRFKANKTFEDRYGIKMAFKQSEFFGHVIKFLQVNEEEFIDSVIKPLDSAFWNTKKANE